MRNSLGRNQYLQESIIQKPLLKIKSQDIFPCYSCGGQQQILIRDCQVCDKTGILKGSHAMVILVQKIIQKKFKYHQTQDDIQNILDKSQVLSENIYEEAQQQIHYGIQCDKCEQKPLKGKRFSCQMCEEYDLCQNCYLLKDHMKDHNFKIVQIESRKKLQSEQEIYGNEKIIDRNTQKSQLMRSIRLSIGQKLKKI